MSQENIYNRKKHEEEKVKKVPKCCITCENYHNQFYKVQHKECAAFGNIAGVLNDKCGFWSEKTKRETGEGENERYGYTAYK